MQNWSLNNLEIKSVNYEITGDIINSVKTPVQNRRGFAYNSYIVSVPKCFYRFIGVKGNEKEYYDYLYLLDSELSKYKGLYVKFDRGMDREISLQILNKLDNAWKRIYFDDVADSSEIIEELDKEGLFPRFTNDILGLQIKNNFRGMLEFFFKSRDNVEKEDVRMIVNNIVHWINLYSIKLLSGFDYTSINPKIMYYGNISVEEAFFLILMSTVGCDILYFNPNNSGKFETVDKHGAFSGEINYGNKGEIKEFPRSSSDRVKTAAYSAKRELDETLYSEDSKFYRPWQFVEYNINAKTLRTTYEEINIWIKENALIRDGWSVQEDLVTIPNIFAKVSGTYSEINKYWKDIDNVTNLKKVHFFNKLPLTDHVHLEYSKFNEIYPPGPYSEFDEYKLINAYWWNYKDLRTGLQLNIARKIKELCLNPVIYNRENEDLRDFQVELFSIMINIDKKFMQILQGFDYPQEVPKVIIYNNEKNGNLSFEDCIMLTLLNYMGIDVIIYNPSGYNDIENYIYSNLYDVHTLEKMSFKLDFQKYKEEKKGFFSRLFGKK